MWLDPRHLEQIAVIVEQGTLQQAATKIGTSQPALSRMISTLEARIGTALFERTTRPLSPTAMGLELSQQGRAIRTARLRASEAVNFGAQGFFGVLKVGAPPFLCRSLMSEVIASFLSARPKIRIDLIPDYHVGLLERIYLNQIDVVVGPSKFVDPGDNELVVDPLFTDRIVIVVRADHALAQANKPSPADLQDKTWVSHSERSVLLSDMEHALRLLGLKSPRVSFQSESAGAVLELIKETDYLTVLPTYAVRADGGDGLAILDIALPAPEHVISAITLADRTETKLTTDFKAHLREQVKNRKAPKRLR